MAFQDVDNSGKVVNAQAAKVPPSNQEAKGKTEADRDDELARSVIEDDHDDSYEELQHSLPMDFSNGCNDMKGSHKSEMLKPDRIDQLLGEEVETDRYTMVLNQPSPS